MALTGLIVGIPLFYGVGFVVLVPLVFSLAARTKLPAVHLGAHRPARSGYERCPAERSGCHRAHAGGA
jgi:hypothetical protein